MEPLPDLAALIALADDASGPGAEAFAGLSAGSDGVLTWPDGDVAAVVSWYRDVGIDASALAGWWAAATPTTIGPLLDELDALRAGLRGRVTVRHLGEAMVEADHHDAVALLVDHEVAAEWCTHPRRLVLVCDDVENPDDLAAFTPRQARRLVRWARRLQPCRVLVACHYGESRSTAAALVILQAWGWPAVPALRAVRRAVPPERAVTPNKLIVERGRTALGRRTWRLGVGARRTPLG